MYRALFDEEEFSHKLPLKALKIRVPETAAVFSNLYWISYSKSGLILRLSKRRTKNRCELQSAWLLQEN